MASSEYEEQILQWRAKRYNALVGENGWMALAGLSWLKSGRNLVGSNPMCEVALPEHAPTFLGIIEWSAGRGWRSGAGQWQAGAKNHS
jgi:hypothetical protein